jgi:16S rRNA (cytidine1402-2'-O)-methyltransferase
MREPESEPQSPGTLYVVATPIGNLEDLSPRAERILSEASLIAAEDTRVTRRLLAQRGLGKQPMLSFHDHNEAQRTGEILRKLQDGRDVALVSDAGTPLISDPGFRLVRAAAEAGIRVVAVPGPCAVVAALSLSGLPTDRFLVLGFFPRRSAKRRAALQEIRRERSTLVFFEAPHRVLETLADVEGVLGDRQLVLARNLTKEHEQVLRGRVSQVRAILAAQEFVAGELTLVVEGAVAASDAAWPEAVERAIERLLADGLPPSQVQSIVSDVFQLNRKSVYQYILGTVREPQEAEEPEDPA